MVTKFAGVQKCLTHWMKTKKKGKYDPWWFTVNISQYIIIFFNENDTNEVKGLYHDDCLEKRKKDKKKQHILHVELGYGG